MDRWADGQTPKGLGKYGWKWQAILSKSSAPLIKYTPLIWAPSLVMKLKIIFLVHYNDEFWSYQIGVTEDLSILRYNIIFQVIYVFVVLNRGWLVIQLSFTFPKHRLIHYFKVMTLMSDNNIPNTFPYLVIF